MSNRLEELHSKYKRYYLKKIIKMFTSIASLIVLGFFGYMLFEEIKKTPSVKPLLAKMQAQPIVKKKEEFSVKKEEKEILPVYAVSVSDDVLEASVQSIENKKPILQEKKQTRIQEPKNLFANVKPAQEKKFKNYFQEPKDEKSLDSWIEKYNQKRSYVLAIYISKQYYSDKNFKQAGIWAKRANQLDRNKEEAWIYYAKSMKGLGDLNKASKILKIYLQYKESAKAELLLAEWSQ